MYLCTLILGLIEVVHMVHVRFPHFPMANIFFHFTPTRVNQSPRRMVVITPCHYNSGVGQKYNGHSLARKPTYRRVHSGISHIYSVNRPQGKCRKIRRQQFDACIHPVESTLPSYTLGLINRKFCQYVFRTASKHHHCWSGNW